MELLKQITDVLKNVYDIFIKAAPTLVAVLAIWINNKSAKKRDKNNREANSRLKILWDICEFTDELYFEANKIGMEAFSQTSGDISEWDIEKSMSIEKLQEKIVVVQRKVKVSSEIYETVGEMQLGWEKLYEACDSIIGTSDQILEEILGDEKIIQQLGATLQNNLIRFEEEYKKYITVVYKEIKRIIDK